MKAYKISCFNDDAHGHLVVFADSPAEARRKDIRDCDCEFVEVVIRRAKAFDYLSPGPVTIADYLKHGWVYPCGNCQDVTLCADDSPIIIGDFVYCNEDCVSQAREAWRGLDGSNAHESVRSYCDELDEHLNKAS